MISLGWQHSCILLDDDEFSAYCYGNDDYDQTTIPSDWDKDII